MSLKDPVRLKAAWRKASRKYRQKNLDKRRLGNRRWRERDLERHRSNDRLRSKAWREANPDRKAAQAKNDKARRRGAIGRITPKQWLQIVADSLGLCVYCNERKPLTLEHIDPIVRGGEHSPDNAAAACGTCNSSKHDRPLLLWLAERALCR